MMEQKSKYEWKNYELDGYSMSVKDFLELHEKIPYDTIFIFRSESRALDKITLEELKEKYINCKGHFYLRDDDNKFIDWYKNVYLPCLWFVVDDDECDKELKNESK
ncbi:MAG: hypothetical protein ACI4PF_02235 [Christensenellales bacterium]